MRLEAAFRTTHSLCWEGTPSEAENERLASEWLTKLGNVDLEDITTQSVTTALEECHCSPSTKNRKTSVLSKTLHLMADHGQIDRAPKLHRFKEPRPMDRSMTKEEYGRILECMEGPGARAVTVLYGTGARVGELLAMANRDVMTGLQPEWTIPRSKNGDPRTVPLMDAVKTAIILQRIAIQKSHGTGTTVVPNCLPFGVDITQRQLTYQWELAREKANLPQFRLHDLRHTFASRMVRKGVSVFTVSHLLGHRDVQTTMRYAHLDTGALHAAVATLGEDEQ